MDFKINDKAVTGVQAELHYLNWCLSLINEHNDVPHCALDAIADFQRGAFRGDDKAKQRLMRAGIKLS